MSTTVTYKGSSLTTINNATRVLETGGTWLEDDITIENVSSGGGTPSATAHTILFDFEDETSATIMAYYNNAFISDAIRATTPTEYSSKTVQQASLDGVIWYTKPTFAWENVFEGNVNYYHDNDVPYPYCWITELADVYPAEGSVWRITFDGNEYICTATRVNATIVIGNPLYSNEQVDDGSNVPIAFYNSGWGAWSGAINRPNEDSRYSVKIERQVIA